MCNYRGAEEEEEEAENRGLVSGQGVSPCRRHGTWQGEEPGLTLLTCFTPHVH